MQYALKVFEYEQQEKFRVIDRDGEPWFVLNEVCKQLGIANVSDAARRLDGDEKDDIDIVDVAGRKQKFIVSTSQAFIP
ncbi:hypothetical protein NB311A_17079 [Nitrobacter sp. Nb-311A]|uniref:BRO-N domain-containing protein n=1 Tax=Nitrobacter sp. Nb-311A TaxID=314253 RepID=UPI000068736A|nr:Bro-N domain-containing protein [Nitrobacter sp. Nb-311A]EAQ35510.1 hypothetical protein NB311A_17079 [Nitrobacter sp. Nb-311A]